MSRMRALVTAGTLLFVSSCTPQATTVPPQPDLIVFTSQRDGNWEIYRMRLDGSDLVRLTNDPAEDRGPWWSEDGEQIYFRSDRTGDFAYYSMDLNGQNVRPHEPLGALSPDGRLRISARLTNGFPQLFQSGSDGEQQLTNNTSDPRLSFADWAPDGRSILYLAGQGPGSLKIWLLDLDSREARLITPQDGTHNTAAFSPDGTRVVFNSNRQGKMSTYIMNTSGEVLTRLLADRISAHASWVSDSLIVLDTESAPGVFDVHVVSTDGSGLANLSRSGNDGWPSIRRGSDH